MGYMGFSRRTVLAGLASATFARPSYGEGSPVAIGALANNKLAQAFETAPSYLPGVAITGPGGDRPLGEIIKGRTVLMPIWAEWCAPCLIELSDFSRLQQVYGNERFAIIPILSGTQKQFTPQFLGEFLNAANAKGFEPLMEANYGSTLAKTMARKSSSYELPCNVLIAPDGNVVGREMSLLINDDDASQSVDNKTRLNEAVAGKSQSLWGTPAGDEFATCLASGFVKFS